MYEKTVERYDRSVSSRKQQTRTQISDTRNNTHIPMNVTFANFRPGMITYSFQTIHMLTSCLPKNIAKNTENL